MALSSPTPTPTRFRFRLAPLVVAVVATSMACLQGARAPVVEPRGTLAPENPEAGLAASEGPFGVVFGAPKGATVDPSEVTLVFNRPLRALELAENQAAPPVIMKPAAPGKWIWVGTSGIQFVPEGRELARATEYAVEVPAGTRALDGSKMAKPYVLRFSTVRPRLLSVTGGTPTGGGSDSSALEPEATFKLRFNQPVDEAEVARATSFFVGENEVRAAFDVKRPDPKNDLLVEVVPRARLPLATPLRINVDASLRGREGPLPAGEPRTESFQTYGLLQLKGVTCSQETPHKRCSAEDGFAIELSNPVKFKEIKRALKIAPAVALRWPRWLDDDEVTQNVQVWGRFVPGRTYRASIAAGAIKDVHGQPLARAMNESVAFDDYWPRAEIGVRGTLFDAASRRPIAVASVNVPSLEVVTAPLDEDTIVGMDDERSYRFDNLKHLRGAKSTTVHPGAATNVPAQHPVDPAAVLGGKDKRGPLMIGIAYDAANLSGRRVESTSLVAITDLGISAKVSPRGSLVWVTRLSTGAPVAGATVSVKRPGAGGYLTEVTTDANGFAPIPEADFVPSDSNEKAVIFARLGDDWAYHRVHDTVEGYRFGVWADLSPDRPFGMIFSDRGIYRPGDTVRLKGIFREEAKTGTATPAGRSVELDVESSDGQPVSKTTLALSAFGTLSADVKLPATGRLGSYSVRARVGGSPRSYPDVSAEFEVAEYRAAEFKASVQSDRPAYIRGDQASFTARGDYLFGAPMSGAEAHLDVTRSQTYFSPPGLDEFTTDDGAYQSGVPESSQRLSQLQDVKAKLDPKGSASLAASLAMPGQRGPELVTCEADITDLSRQMISASTSALVHPGEFYVALDGGADLFLKPGDPARPRVLAVDPKGNKIPGVAVTIDLVQRKWTVAKQAVGGGFRTESSLVDHVVASCNVTTGSAPASCSLLPPGAGYYLLHAGATDRRKNPVASSVGIYVTGDIGETSWGDNDKQAVELVPDRKSYEVGQTAHVLVKSPFKSAEALVTVERSGVYTQRRMTLSGPMPTIDVPVGADLRPNAFVSVLLVRGRTKAAPDKADKPDVGAPSFRLGYAPIPVNPEARRLKIALKPSKNDLGPGDTVDVDLDVKDRAGKPVRSEITLYAVDEGVLSLIGYKTPDPIPVFGAPRSLKVTTGESREELAKLLNPFAALGLDKGLDGGDGGSGSGARKDFKASAYFNPALVTDAEGHAHASFKLPDNLTTFRLMAVAAAEDDRFGYAQDRLTVSRPLMARPAFPRFVRAGDKLDAGIVVTSKGLAKAKIDVTVSAEGLTLAGEATKSIEVDANSSAEVRFAFDAPRVGSAKVRFKIKGGGAEDAVEVTREIKAPAVLEAVALYGDTTKASGEKLGDLAAIRDDVGGLDVSLSSTALVGLNSGVDQLIQYPYGCTEQLVSRLVPLLPLRDLARDYHVDLPKDLDPLVNKAVADILTHQRSDGGFGFWAESSQANPWVTAYALWGLSTAQRRHVSVREGAIKDAVAYLRRELPQMSKDPLLFASAPFILDVLAELGEPDPGNLSNLFEKRADLPLFSRALLLHAMVLAKSEGALVEQLVSEIEGHVRLDGNTARAVANEGSRYAVLMDSEARTSALVLRGFLAARPSHPLGAKLAMGLLAARRGGAWRNTQETAWALLALDDYRKAQEKTEPDFTAHVFLGEAELYRAAFHGRSLENPKTQVKAAGLAAGSGSVLSFDVEGQGRLFYEARLRYAPRALPQKGLDRGFFVRKTLRAVTTAGLEEALKSVPETGALAFKGGDLILADVVVVTRSPREIVVIDDPLPAGFEAVDAHLATTGASYNVDSADARANDEDEGDDDDADRRAAGPTYRGSSFVRELRDDRVLFFVDHLSAGMFRYRYLARATTNGSFVVPPTKVEEMYTPEVFGRTGSALIKISP